MRPVKRLADVDVAQPGDDALVQQRRLDVLDPAGERLGQRRGVESRVERLRSQRLEPGMLGQGPGCDQVHVAEPAGVEIGDPRPAIGAEQDMGVLVLEGGGFAEGAGAGPVGPFDLETSAHPQVHHQGLVRPQPREQVLGPPVERLDPGAGQALDEPLGQGEAQVWTAGLHARQACAREHGLQAPAHGFDLGKLRH